MLVRLLFVLFIKVALGDNVVRIKDANEFIEFSNDVTSGTNYSGTTVLLDSDLSFSGKILEPIGNSSKYFSGTFDGRGHIISDLRINTSSQLAGIFGLSSGLAIRNVVLNSSCSIVSTFTGNDIVRVGGIIGLCYASGGECNIENSVNMAIVNFNGNTTGNHGVLQLGGISGYISSSSSKYDAYVKNCVNYGSVTDSGTVGVRAEIGGIVGASEGISSYVYIQNCLNYGTFTHNKSSGYLYVGGVVGYCYNTYIENCVSAGNISTRNTPSTSSIGGIVGFVHSDVHINYCYYTSDVNASSINGYGTPSKTGTPDTTSDANSDLVSKLNSNATSCNWDNWFMLYLNGGRINNLTQNTLIGIQGHIPNPVKEGNSFLFWCKDAECTEEFEAESVSGTTDLYAAWVNNTVTFDFNNGTTVNDTFSYSTEIVYPDNLPEKEGYTLSWDNYHELMPAKNITVTAQWISNNYTVTFDFDNGTTVNDTFSYNTFIEYPKNEDMKRERYIFVGWNESGIVHMPAHNITITALWKANNYTVTFDVNGGNNLYKTSMTATFNSPYGPLPENVTRTGHMFLGWFTDSNESVKSETIVRIADNHTLHAQWEKITSQVEIVFNTKDMSKEEVEELVKKYTDAEFTITEFEEESGEIRVIIRFINNEDAAMFVRNANELSRGNGDNLIKRVSFVSNNDASFSLLLCPTLFLTSLL